MKKLIIASAITAAFASHTAVAEEAAAPEATPEHVVAYNVGFATEYRYRGISQSQKDSALSAGVDYTHSPTGLYAGSWMSTIKWIEATGQGQTTPILLNGPVEIDIYAGQRGDIGGGFNYDVGGLFYYYPGNDYKLVGVDANTFELYGQVGYGPAYLKYSRALTDLFGNTTSDGSYYIDAGVNQPLAEGLTLNLHAGRQIIKTHADLNYTDWKVGLTKDFGFLVGAISYIGTDADKSGYKWNGVYVGSHAVVGTVTKNF